MIVTTIEVRFGGTQYFTLELTDEQTRDLASALTESAEKKQQYTRRATVTIERLFEHG